MRSKNLTGLLAVVMTGFALFSACGGRSASSLGGTDTSGPIKVNYVAQNRAFSYDNANPLVMPDGAVIRSGDLKPFWQWIEKRLGIQFEDVTSQTLASGIMQTESATGFVGANIYGGNTITGDLMNFGTQGYFINLAQFINSKDMPNLYKFLEENPDVRKAMTAYDGGIYFVPYIAEIGYVARTFLGRHSWITTLLDGGSALETETATLNVSYSGFWKDDNARHASNVIVLQNNAAANGRLNFATARNTLVSYINSTYPNLARPSDLFLGTGAQYDIDELAALWRVVRLAPNTLSRVASGAVVPGAEIVPFFHRQSSDRGQYFRLANFFGGQRAFGSDSQDATLYQDENGTLQFSLNQDKFLFTFLPHLRSFFEEGLIAPDAFDLTNRSNFRTIYFGGDLRDGNTNFGFMTEDFIPSSTNIALGNGRLQTDVKGMLPPMTTLPGMAEDFAQFREGRTPHFLENTRTVKNDGWAISSTTGGKKLKDIIALFDFIFSDEGYIAQNYGMPDLLEPEPFINPAGVAFPRMSSWFNEQADQFSGGDGALFSRAFIGFNFPIGYMKSIGFEQQFTSIYGDMSWELLENSNVIATSYAATHPFYSLVPPVFSLDSRLQRQLQLTNIGEIQNNMIFSFIETGAPSVTQIREAFIDGKVDDYVEIYREAFAMMSGR